MSKRRTSGLISPEQAQQLSQLQTVATQQVQKTPGNQADFIRSGGAASGSMKARPKPAISGGGAADLSAALGAAGEAMKSFGKLTQTSDALRQDEMNKEIREYQDKMKKAKEEDVVKKQQEAKDYAARKGIETGSVEWDKLSPRDTLDFYYGLTDEDYTDPGGSLNDDEYIATLRDGLPDHWNLEKQRDYIKGIINKYSPKMWSSAGKESLLTFEANLDAEYSKANASELSSQLISLGDRLADIPGMTGEKAEEFINTWYAEATARNPDLAMDDSWNRLIEVQKQKNVNLVTAARAEEIKGFVTMLQETGVASAVVDKILDAINTGDKETLAALYENVGFAPGEEELQRFTEDLVTKGYDHYTARSMAEAQLWDEQLSEDTISTQRILDLAIPTLLGLSEDDPEFFMNSDALEKIGITLGLDPKLFEKDDSGNYSWGTKNLPDSEIIGAMLRDELSPGIDAVVKKKLEERDLIRETAKLQLWGRTTVNPANDIFTLSATLPARQTGETDTAYLQRLAQFETGVDEVVLQRITNHANEAIEEGLGTEATIEFLFNEDTGTLSDKGIEHLYGDVARAIADRSGGIRQYEDVLKEIKQDILGKTYDALIKSEIQLTGSRLDEMVEIGLSAGLTPEVAMTTMVPQLYGTLNDLLSRERNLLLLAPTLNPDGSISTAEEQLEYDIEIVPYTESQISSEETTGFSVLKYTNIKDGTVTYKPISGQSTIGEALRDFSGKLSQAIQTSQTGPLASTARAGSGRANINDWESYFSSEPSKPVTSGASGSPPPDASGGLRLTTTNVPDTDISQEDDTRIHAAAVDSGNIPSTTVLLEAFNSGDSRKRGRISDLFFANDGQGLRIINKNNFDQIVNGYIDKKDTRQLGYYLQYLDREYTKAAAQGVTIGFNQDMESKAMEFAKQMSSDISTNILEKTKKVFAQSSLMSNEGYELTTPVMNGFASALRNRVDMLEYSGQTWTDLSSSIQITPSSTQFFNEGFMLFARHADRLGYDLTKLKPKEAERAWGLAVDELLGQGERRGRYIPFTELSADREDTRISFVRDSQGNLGSNRSQTTRNILHQMESTVLFTPITSDENTIYESDAHIFEIAQNGSDETLLQYASLMFYAFEDELQTYKVRPEYLRSLSDSPMFVMEWFAHESILNFYGAFNSGDTEEIRKALMDVAYHANDLKLPWVSNPEDGTFISQPYETHLSKYSRNPEYMRTRFEVGDAVEFVHSITGEYPPLAFFQALTPGITQRELLETALQVTQGAGYGAKVGYDAEFGLDRILFGPDTTLSAAAVEGANTIMPGFNSDSPDTWNISDLDYVRYIEGYPLSMSLVGGGRVIPDTTITRTRHTLDWDGGQFISSDTGHHLFRANRRATPGGNAPEDVLYPTTRAPEMFAAATLGTGINYTGPTLPFLPTGDQLGGTNVGEEAERKGYRSLKHPGLDSVKGKTFAFISKKGDQHLIRIPDNVKNGLKLAVPDIEGESTLYVTENSDGTISLSLFGDYQTYYTTNPYNPSRISADVFREDQSETPNFMDTYNEEREAERLILSRQYDDMLVSLLEQAGESLDEYDAYETDKQQEFEDLLDQEVDSLLSIEEFYRTDEEIENLLNEADDFFSEYDERKFDRTVTRYINSQLQDMYELVLSEYVSKVGNNPQRAYLDFTQFLLGQDTMGSSSPIMEPMSDFSIRLERHRDNLGLISYREAMQQMQNLATSGNTDFEEQLRRDYSDDLVDEFVANGGIGKTEGDTRANWLRFGQKKYEETVGGMKARIKNTNEMVFLSNFNNKANQYLRMIYGDDYVTEFNQYMVTLSNNGHYDGLIEGDEDGYYVIPLDPMSYWQEFQKYAEMRIMDLENIPKDPFEALLPEELQERINRRQTALTGFQDAKQLVAAQQSGRTFHPLIEQEEATTLGSYVADIWQADDQMKDKVVSDFFDEIFSTETWIRDVDDLNKRIEIKLERDLKMGMKRADYTKIKMFLLSLSENNPAYRGTEARRGSGQVSSFGMPETQPLSEQTEEEFSDLLRNIISGLDWKGN